MSDGQKLVIWKYEVPLQSRFTLKLHEGYRVLTVQQQGTVYQMWILIDRAADEETASFFMVGTGQELPTLRSNEFGEYIATLQGQGWKAVHLFRAFSVETDFMSADEPLDRSKMQ